MAGPLDDLVVLDLTRALAGPLAGRLLSDLGAEVVKVEPPDGDLTRAMLPAVARMSVYYVHANAGKRCVSLDLTRDEGRHLLLRMVERADVVLENYRPGVLERLGLGYDVLAERNPQVVLASISGWGHGNSRSAQGAFAGLVHAETGATATLARCLGEPLRHDPISHADNYAGMQALVGLLAALHQRHRTGRGQAVEVSMAESMLVANDIAPAELSGIEPDEGFRAGQHRSPIYALAGGRPVTITCDPTTDGGFQVWWRAMDRPDLADDPRFCTPRSRAEHRAALDGEIGSWVATFDDPRRLEAALGVSTVMVAEVRTTTEIAETAWASERGAIVEVAVRGEPVRVAQSPWRFSSGGTGVRPRVSFRGEDNREVLRRLAGASDEELDALERLGVLSSRVPPA